MTPEELERLRNGGYAQPSNMSIQQRVGASQGAAQNQAQAFRNNQGMMGNARASGPSYTTGTGSPLNQAKYNPASSGGRINLAGDTSNKLYTRATTKMPNAVGTIPGVGMALTLAGGLADAYDLPENRNLRGQVNQSLGSMYPNYKSPMPEGGGLPFQKEFMRGLERAKEHGLIGAYQKYAGNQNKQDSEWLGGKVRDIAEGAVRYIHSPEMAQQFSQYMDRPSAQGLTGRTQPAAGQTMQPAQEQAIGRQVQPAQTQTNGLPFQYTGPRNAMGQRIQSPGIGGSYTVTGDHGSEGITLADGRTFNNPTQGASATVIPWDAESDPDFMARTMPAEQYRDIMGRRGLMQYQTDLQEQGGKPTIPYGNNFDPHFADKQAMNILAAQQGRDSKQFEPAFKPDFVSGLELDDPISEQRILNIPKPAWNALSQYLAGSQSNDEAASILRQFMEKTGLSEDIIFRLLKRQ